MHVHLAIDFSSGLNSHSFGHPIIQWAPHRARTVIIGPFKTHYPGEQRVS